MDRTRLVHLAAILLFLGWARVGHAQALPQAESAQEALAAAAAGSMTDARAAGEAWGPFATDRPDFTESSQVVGRGVLQVETGMTFESNASHPGAVRTLSAPLALVRLGVSPRLEIRLGAEGLLSTWTPSASLPHLTGGSDVELGVKSILLREESQGLDLALIPVVSLPTGAGPFSSGSVDPELKIAWSRSLPGDFGLTGNINLASVSTDDRRAWERGLTLSLGHDLAGGWAGFWEVYDILPGQPGVGQGWTFDAGVSRVVRDRVQFDVSAGLGLSDSAPDWFIGVGFSVRARIFR